MVIVIIDLFIEGVEVFQRGCITTWVRGHSPLEHFEMWSLEMPIFPAFWAVLVFRAKIKKSATLYGDPPYRLLMLEYFLAYRYSKIGIALMSQNRKNYNLIAFMLFFSHFFVLQRHYRWILEGIIRGELIRGEYWIYSPISRARSREKIWPASLKWNWKWTMQRTHL